VFERVHVGDLPGLTVHHERRTVANTMATSVFLRRPQMSASFTVAAVAIGDHGGRLEGDELDRVAKFIWSSTGVPQFEVEYDGQRFCGCRLTGEADDSISFSCESITIVSSPIAS